MKEVNNLIKIEIEYDDRNVMYGHRPSFKIIISGEDETMSHTKLNKIIDTIQEVLFS